MGVHLYRYIFGSECSTSTTRKVSNIFGPQVNLADNEISSSVTSVSEITVDAKDYDTDQYTLVESKLCVNLKYANFGIQDLQLRLTTKGGFVMLKAQNQGVGNELSRTCFTDTAGSMIPKTSDGGSLFEGDWLPKSGLISDRVNQFPGTSGWARMMVKDHGATGRDYTGLLEWSLELCFDGWEEPYNHWLEDEEERIRKKEEEKAKPWCTSAPVTPTDAPLTPPNTTDMPTTEPSPSPVASPTLPPTQKPTTAPIHTVPECTTTEGSVGKTLRLGRRELWIGYLPQGLHRHQTSLQGYGQQVYLPKAKKLQEDLQEDLQGDCQEKQIPHQRILQLFFWQEERQPKPSGRRGLPPDLWRERPGLLCLFEGLSLKFGRRQISAAGQNYRGAD